MLVRIGLVGKVSDAPADFSAQNKFSSHKRGIYELK